MNANDIPLGDRVLPEDRCEKCGKVLVVLDCAEDEENTVYVGCPDCWDEDGHTERGGIPASVLKVWGWDV